MFSVFMPQTQENRLTRLKNKEKMTIVHEQDLKMRIIVADRSG